MNKQALSNLDRFYGTEGYYRLTTIPSASCVLTDGARFLADNADCYWLFDAIFAAQLRPEVREDSMLQQMQFWSLRRGDGNAATLICERDSGDVAWKQEIEFTDFPFDAISEPRVWVAPTYLGNNTKALVAYLPSEH